MEADGPGSGTVCSFKIGCVASGRVSLVNVPIRSPHLLVRNETYCPETPIAAETDLCTVTSLNPLRHSSRSRRSDGATHLLLQKIRGKPCGHKYQGVSINSPLEVKGCPVKHIIFTNLPPLVGPSTY